MCKHNTSFDLSLNFKAGLAYGTVTQWHAMAVARPGIVAKC